MVILFHADQKNDHMIRISMTSWLWNKFSPIYLELRAWSLVYNFIKCSRKEGCGHYNTIKYVHEVGRVPLQATMNSNWPTVTHPIPKHFMNVYSTEDHLWSNLFLCTQPCVQLDFQLCLQHISYLIQFRFYNHAFLVRFRGISTFISGLIASRQVCPS